ncbi:MAG: fibrillarin-like rRNA/tRNA 2'-O-methyltransferase [archaeon]
MNQIKNLIIKDGMIGTIDLNSSEKRIWDPSHSKVAAGIKKGIKEFPINENSKVLYLGAAEGYTISFISDIASNGIVIGADISAHSMQKLYLLSLERANLIPLLGDCNKPETYVESLAGEKFDLIIQDIAQKNQVEILVKNSDLFLKEKGYVLLSLKLSALTQKKDSNLREDQLELFRKHFNLIDQKKLDPFEKKHMLLLGQKK